MHNVFHLSFLYQYLPHGTQQKSLDPIVAGDNQEYKIKRIVSHIVRIRVGDKFTAINN